MKRALVLSLAIVLGLGLAAFAQELTGSWDTTITIDPQALALGDLFSFTSDLTVTYKVAGWTFSSFTTLDDTGWSAQSFTAGGALGAFTFGSTLVFAPATPAFTSWTVTGGVSIAGMTFDMTFVSTPGEVALTLGGYGSAGLVDIDIDVTFGDPTAESGCDFDWTGITIVAGFPFCCVETVDFTLAFTCDGFEYAQFDVVGIEVPMLPWLFIDATLKYELQTKTLTLSPNFVFGADVCFDLYMGFGYGGNLIIDDLYIEGIGLICEIDGISFEGISFWGNLRFRHQADGAWRLLGNVPDFDDRRRRLLRTV